ncbi:MAG: cell division protein ZapA [Clostridia bacterium]|nr:cell division protein ZapA [Clostridia bacterium]
MQKTRTTVRIAGRDYAMSGYDTEEYMHRVAAYVDRTMTEISLSAVSLTQVQLAVLTALNVADDMLKAHDENNRLKREVEQLHIQLDELRAGR